MLLSKFLVTLFKSSDGVTDTIASSAPPLNLRNLFIKIYFKRFGVPTSSGYAKLFKEIDSSLSFTQSQQCVDIQPLSRLFKLWCRS